MRLHRVVITIARRYCKLYVQRTRIVLDAACMDVVQFRLIYGAGLLDTWVV